MKNKNEKQEDLSKMNESNYDPPAEFIDSVNRESKSVPSDEESKKAKSISDQRLEKFKRGELGAAHIRYNDDGDQSGATRKLDIDTKSELK